MRRVANLTVLLCVLFSTARAGLDLTPTLHEFSNEGFKYRELLFKDEKKQVKYILPDRWSWRGTASSLVLTPPDKAQAEANIETAPLPNPRPFDEACVKELTQRALHSVPAESQNVTIVQQQENPVPINGNPTLEIILSYEVYGEAFAKSVLFLHLPDTELVFKLTARKADFESLHTTFCRSLFSWQWL
jgi:hypothetical protein